MKRTLTRLFILSLCMLAQAGYGFGHNRIVDGNSLNTTRKFTDERGEYRFGGWAGKDAKERVHYELRIESGSFKPKAM